MWSGPRNISTAMMRAWENRPDTAVWDEPFYGPYLADSGLDHPGKAGIIAAQGSDWRPVAEACRGDAPGGAPVFFQKHMTHHMLPHMDLDWMGDVINCFLIRRPDEVLASYRRSRAEATAADLGYQQQARLVEHVDRMSGTALVLESADVLRDPRGSLSALCASVGVAFDDAMLSWPAGRRESDGVWGPYWYDSVWKSTGFLPYRARELSLDDDDRAIIAECQPYYDQLHERRLQL